MPREALAVFGLRQQPSSSRIDTFRKSVWSAEIVKSDTDANLQMSGQRSMSIMTLKDLSDEDLKELHSLIAARKLSITAAIQRTHSSYATINARFSSPDLPPLRPKKGRRLLPIDDGVGQKITEYWTKDRVGFQRCPDALSARGIEISEKQIRKVYKEEHLFTYEHELKPKNKHLHRLHAPYAG
jgi:hypothetical protein